VAHLLCTTDDRRLRRFVNKTKRKPPHRLRISA